MKTLLTLLILISPLSTFAFTKADEAKAKVVLNLDAKESKSLTKVLNNQKLNRDESGPAISILKKLFTSQILSKQDKLYMLNPGSLSSKVQFLLAKKLK